MPEPAPIEAALTLDGGDVADGAASTELFRYLSDSLDDREAFLRAREQAVAERSSLLAERARELAHVEALVTAREEVLREREQRVETVQGRLREDASRLEERFGTHAGARRVLKRAAELDRIELDIVAQEVALEVREAEWWAKVTGLPEEGEPT